MINYQQHQTYLRFFNLMEQIVDKEFQDTDFQVNVNNHYIREKKPQMTIDMSLKCNDQTIKIQVFIDKDFPKRSRPKIYSIDMIQSQIIDKNTREIQYQGIYSWSERPKLKPLIQQIQQYFISNPVKQLHELEKNNQKYKEINSKIQDLDRINWVSYESTLSNDDKQKLYKKEENYNIIIKHPQIKEIQNTFQTLQKNIHTQINEIETNENDIKQSLESIQPQLQQYKNLQQQYQQLNSDYKNLEERFTRQNIWEYLQNLKMNCEQRVEEMQTQIKNEGFGDMKLLDDYYRMQKKLAITTYLYNDFLNAV